MDEADEEELQYFVDQIRKSGRFNVTPCQSSTPLSSHRRSGEHLEGRPVETDTPTRDLNSRHITFDKADVPPPKPTSHDISTYPSYLDSSVTHARIPKLPLFSGEGKPGECEFEVWRYDLNCLLRGGMYPSHILQESIRNSLKGRARTVLLHLGERASISDVIAELEAIYGNVATSERLKEAFYCAKQGQNESVAEYSLRLERLLTNANLSLDRNTKDDMLRNRLWSGLRDNDLRNATRYKFESIFDFNVLRKEIRSIEEDFKARTSTYNSVSCTPPQIPMSQYVSSSKAFDRKPVPEVSCSSNMSVVEHKIIQQLEELALQMKRMNSRVETVEKELSQLKKVSESSTPDSGGTREKGSSSYRGGYNRGSYNRGGRFWSGRGRGYSFDGSRNQSSSVADKQDQNSDSKSPATGGLNESRPSIEGN